MLRILKRWRKLKRAEELLQELTRDLYTDLDHSAKLEKIEQKLLSFNRGLYNPTEYKDEPNPNLLKFDAEFREMSQSYGLFACYCVFDDEKMMKGGHQYLRPTTGGEMMSVMRVETVFNAWLQKRK